MSTIFINIIKSYCSITLRFLCCKVEVTYKVTEAQINKKVIKWSFVNVSPYKVTPINNISVGAIYCKKPVNDSGICNTAIPNNNNGTAVAMPDMTSNESVVKC